MAHSLEQIIDHTNNLSIAMAKSRKEPISDIGRIQTNCHRHGQFFSEGKKLSRQEIWTTCPTCRIDAHEAEIEKSRIARQAKIDEAHQRLIERAAIPLRFVNRTLKNFKAETKDQVKALQASVDFSSNWQETQKKGSWLVFSGKPGTGKSHLAIAILQSIMPDHVGRYMTCMELIQTIRATWRKDSENSETELLEMMTNIPLLVLDEIGVQYGTESEQHHLFDVLDRRYREMRPTILLTNQNKDGFRQFVGDRVYDRMTEVARWVPFDWDSHRVQARKDFA